MSPSPNGQGLLLLARKEVGVVFTLKTLHSSARLTSFASNGRTRTIRFEARSGKPSFVLRLLPSRKSLLLEGRELRLSAVLEVVGFQFERRVIKLSTRESSTVISVDVA